MEQGFGLLVAVVDPEPGEQESITDQMSMNTDASVSRTFNGVSSTCRFQESEMEAT